MHESFNVLLDLIIPEGVSDYFKLTGHKKENGSIHIYLEDINNIPEEYPSDRIKSKAFLPRLSCKTFHCGEMRFFCTRDDAGGLI